NIPLRSPQKHVPEPDRRDVARSEVFQPGLQHAAEGGLARSRTAVTDPEFGVTERSELFALDHPGIEVGGDPGLEARETGHAVARVRGTTAGLPVAQQLCDTARREVG